MENQERILYKYSSIDSAEKILCTQKILAPSPAKFNDPFDCNLSNLILDPKLFDAAFCKAFVEKLRKIAGWMAPKPGEEVATKFRKFIESEYNSRIMSLWKDFANQHRILCFSELNDSILMWSHYAANHAGVVIGFNQNFSGINSSEVKYENNPNLFQALIEKMVCEIFNNSPKKRTKNKFPDQFSNNFFELCREHMFLKNAVWGYECEHRMVVPSDPKQITVEEENIIESGFMKFDSKAVSEIIFGVNFFERNSPESQMSILTLIKEKYPAAKRKEAKKERGYS